MQLTPLKITNARKAPVFQIISPKPTRLSVFDNNFSFTFQNLNQILGRTRLSLLNRMASSRGHVEISLCKSGLWLKPLNCKVWPLAKRIHHNRTAYIRLFEIRSCSLTMHILTRGLDSHRGFGCWGIRNFTREEMKGRIYPLERIKLLV